MARILLCTGGVPGHVNPVIPVSEELSARGHEVVWLTAPCNRDKVEATGAEFVPFAPESAPGERNVYDQPAELTELHGLAQVKAILRWTIDCIAAEVDAIDEILARFPADVMTGDPFFIGPFVRSATGGPPSALLFFTPLAISSRDTAPYGLGLLPPATPFARLRNRLLYVAFDRFLFRDVNRYAASAVKAYGLSLNGPFLQAAFQFPAAVLVATSPKFEYPRSDLPAHVHFIGPLLLQPDVQFQPPAWWASMIDSPRPVVVINQGTMAVDMADLIHPALAGLNDEPLFVVAVPVQDGQCGDLPSDFHAEPFIPFGNLLPHVDVMVTNGGYGGVQNALAHGIPLVIAGDSEDKMEVAARVEWSGAGINLRTKFPSAESIRGAVRTVLASESYRASARRIQADFCRYDARRRAAELLETLASQQPTGQGR